MHKEGVNQCIGVTPNSWLTPGGNVIFLLFYLKSVKFNIFMSNTNNSNVKMQLHQLIMLS